jgi:CBS domain containing-hemolysin-like protein
VPGRVTAADLLQQFKKSQMNLAIVVDEYGEPLGIVTLEDVLEVGGTHSGRDR